LSLLAISVGAVFFGAATYIGNRPNFMVKAVADQQKVRTPAFPGFVFEIHAAFPVADAAGHLADFLSWLNQSPF